MNSPKIYDLELDLASHDEADEELIRSIPTELIEEGETLYRQGDPPVEFCIIKVGSLEVAKHSPEGTKSILGIFGPGEPVGAMAVINDFPYPATVSALQQTIVYRISADLLPRLQQRAPQWLADCLGQTAGRFTDLASRFQSMSTRDLAGRLAGQLWRMAEKYGRQNEDDEVLIDTKLTRQMLADMVGCRVESAIRQLSQWEQDGLIQTHESRIRLLHPRRMKSLADED